MPSNEQKHRKVPDSEFEGRPELVRQRTRAIFVQRVAIAIGVAVMVIMLGTTTFSAIIDMQTREEWLDCNTPEGECRQREMEAIEGFIARLQDYNRRVVVHAVRCSDRPGKQTRKQVERCVRKGLEND